MQYLEIFALVLGFVIGYLTCFVVSATMKRPVNRRVATATVATVATRAKPERQQEHRRHAKPFRVTGYDVYQARDYGERHPKKSITQIKKALKLPYNISTVGSMIRVGPTSSPSQDERIAYYDKLEAAYIESVE